MSTTGPNWGNWDIFYLEMCRVNQQIVAVGLILVCACSGDSPPDETALPDISYDDVEFEFDWILEDIPDEDSNDADSEDLLVDPGPCEGLPDGAECDDNSLCTLDDSCKDGFCVPGASLDCGEDESGACNIAYCEPEQGCINATAPDGNSCFFPCFTEAACISGECIATAGAEMPCPEPDDPCVEKIACNPDSNQCTLSIYKLACPKGSLCQAEEGPNGPGKLSCVPTFEYLCMPCNSNKDCNDPLFEQETQLCIPTPEEQGSFCGADCGKYPCPSGYECSEMVTEEGKSVKQCVPEEGIGCDCKPEWAAVLAWTSCNSKNEYGICSGKRVCSPEGLKACSAKTPSAEICDGIDNNCNTLIDEGTEELCGSPGACCLKEGGCQGLFEQSCLNIGGIYQGTGVDCTQAACGGAEQGACCLPNQECTSLEYVQCEDIGGSYKGDGMVCDAVNCAKPDPLGACCHISASCALFSALQCLQQESYFQGNGVGCADVTCKPKGACCLPSGQCQVSSQAACKGLWNPGFPCDEVECLPTGGNGACCLDGGACAVLPLEECDKQAGQFLAGEICFGQCGGTELGACCYLNGECSQTGMDDCPAGADWKGLESSCSDSPCGASEIGACCAIGACYEGFSPAECAALPGEYQGKDSTCEDCK